MTNYKQLYDALISYRKINVLEKTKEQLGMIESHHIIPCSCGGIDEPQNIVNLYAKEHFIAHYYLWKIHENDKFKYQTLKAFWMMSIASSSNQNRTYQPLVKMSEEYQQARIEFSKYLTKTMPDKVKGEKNGMFGRHWYYDPVTNKSCVFVEGQQPIGWVLGKKHKDPKAFSEAVSRGNKKRYNGKHYFRVYNPITGQQLSLVEGSQIPNGFEKRGKPLSQHGKQKLHEYFVKHSIEVVAPKRIEELRPQYAYYLQNGWKAFKDHYNYQKSFANFLQLCKRYLPEYKSQSNLKT